MHTSIISRIFGGVEGKAMASNPPWSAASAIFLRMPPRRSRKSPHRPLQLVLRRLDNSLHGETKFPLEDLERCRGPEGPHADALAIPPDILRPAKKPTPVRPRPEPIRRGVKPNHGRPRPGRRTVPMKAY